MDFNFGQSWMPWAIGGGAVVILAGVILLRGKKKGDFVLPKGKGPRKRDVVYLYQFSRCTLGPNPSPFCLKLELFLRMNNIPHEIVSTQTMGPKNKIPYIAYNEEVVSDTDFIVEFLKKELKLSIDDHLDPLQKAIGHAAEQMTEECTYWTVAYRRWVETPDQFPALLTARPSLFLRVILRIVARSTRQSLYCQGTGRHSIAEIVHIAEKDLTSLSNILGDKDFFLGDRPSSYDAAIFGALAIQLWLLPGSAQETFIKTEARNLERYCQRIRDRWFSDWDELCLR